MRRFALLLACASVTALAQAPDVAINSPPSAALARAPKLSPVWEQKAREIYKTAVETPTVAGRHNVPKLANYLADQL